MDTRRKRQGAMRSRLGMIRGTAVAMAAMLQLLPRVGGASFWDNINDVMRQSAPTTPPSTSTASANCPYRYYFLFQVNDEDPAAALERVGRTQHAAACQVSPPRCVTHTGSCVCCWRAVAGAAAGRRRVEGEGAVRHAHDPCERRVLGAAALHLAAGA